MSSTALQPLYLSPGQNLQAYIQTISSVPILSAEEEKALAEAFAETGDLNAARQLVLSHLRFVVHLAKSYSGYGLSEADLIQEGNVGLMKAVKRFDPSMGVRLVSFAVHWIKAEMHEFIIRNWRIVKIATTKAQRKLFFNLRSKKKNLSWLNTKEAQDIAESLNVSVKDVKQMEGRLSAQDAAFDLTSSNEDEGGSLPVPAQILEDDRYNPAELVESFQSQDLDHAKLQNALASLDDRSQDIVLSRWIQEPKATLHDLAAKYGVSAERIRQLEKNAFKKIRQQFA